MAMVFIDFSDEYEGNDILTLFLQYTFGRRTTFIMDRVEGRGVPPLAGLKRRKS